MTDNEELIERLRRTLETEAAAISPSPAGQPRATYANPVPLAHGRLRPRWPLTLAAAAVVAAAVTLGALNWPSGGSSRVGVVAPGPTVTTSPVPATVPATVPAVVPTTVGATAPPTTKPAVAVPPPAPPVPTGFAPQAVTFVSPSDGWVAGAVPCRAGTCLALARTSDAGRTWRSVSAPQATISNSGSGTPAVSVRFANQMDGWVDTVNPSRLWSTHDGGGSWRRVTLPGLTPQGAIMAMEAGAGYVRVAIIPNSPSTVHVEASSVSGDTWTDSDTGVQVGAGPVPSTQLVLQGSQGWLIENDRTVVGGARLTATGHWASWTPPCQTANGTGALAASTPADLVAVCQEGTWGPPGNLPAGATIPSTWLFKSSDGGSSFQRVGRVTAGPSGNSIASPAPATIVMDTLPGSTTAAGLAATFDGGHNWETAYRVSYYVSWSDLGFTTLTQGVAIGSSPSGSSFLLMTRDGGHQWDRVSFSAR